jgi:mono/diheme cytochrome c family protein
MYTTHAGPPARQVRDVACAAAYAMFCLALALPATADETDPQVARGRYLVQIAGCNDCHTPGYMETAGNVEESLWLTGSPVGWHGPWGTTYPPNLRLVVGRLTEAQWLVYARNEWRPPMPWFALRDMTDEDVAAIYRYLRHLGPAGEPAPAALPPGVAPPEPVFRAPQPPAQ